MERNRRRKSEGWKEDKTTKKIKLEKIKRQESITEGKIEEDQFLDFALFILSFGFMIQGSLQESGTTESSRKDGRKKPCLTFLRRKANIFPTTATRTATYLSTAAALTGTIFWDTLCAQGS